MKGIPSLYALKYRSSCQTRQHKKYAERTAFIADSSMVILLKKDIDDKLGTYKRA